MTDVDGSFEWELRNAADRYSDSLGGLHSGVAYALAGGGKRLRGRLLDASYRACGGMGNPVLLAVAVEMVHAYSLVHDDLPCMDDDDLRRGRPTLHRVEGVARAMAAGMALLPLAVHAMLDGCEALNLPERASSRIVGTLARAAGAGGMIGGQLLDLDAEGRDLTLGELEVIHSAKTGALIRASTVMGGLAAETSESRIAALDQYGARIGLAFQIVDDILDVTGTSETLGKVTGRDAALGKSTYPAIMGLREAERRANEIVDAACADLAEAGLLTPDLDALARFVALRTS